MKTSDWLQSVGLVFVILSTALALLNIRKYRNSRAIDFILNAESSIDPLHHALVGGDPALIREIYRNHGARNLSDTDCQAFPYMYSVYAHISRMYFILSAQNLDYGLSRRLREITIETWSRDLALYKDHPAMRALHEEALRSANFNESFLRLADDLLRLDSPKAARDPGDGSSSIAAKGPGNPVAP